MKDMVENATKISMNNKKAVMKSKNCGCYYCCSIFAAKEVTMFVDEEESATCPKCSVDAVIPDAVVPGLNFEMLDAMNKRWFKEEKDMDDNKVLTAITNEYINDIKSILREHGHEGKNKTILVLSAISVVLGMPMIENDINKYRLYSDEKTLLGLLPEYIDNDTWIAVKKYLINAIHTEGGKFNGLTDKYGFSNEKVFELALLLAPKPNSEKELEFANSILDALSNAKR